ncbi:hypothetical protein OF897_08185 [Chryseobacterium formosus]|uniref:Uncharacterized protein n=1 Tax=Chryseobacterium formosus TaxID=1537363 RepID=A0ABT3XRX0_9FLAO|nr:hypothetical protein [Chryseobacterium formosus]
MVNKIAPIENYSVTPLLKKSFWDVFQFINEERIELMKKEDMHTFQELRALYKKISSNSEKNLGLEILAEKLFDFAENFSSQEQMLHFH